MAQRQNWLFILCPNFCHWSLLISAPQKLPLSSLRNTVSTPISFHWGAAPEYIYIYTFFPHQGLDIFFLCTFFPIFLLFFVWCRVKTFFIYWSRLLDVNHGLLIQYFVRWMPFYALVCNCAVGWNCNLDVITLAVEWHVIYVWSLLPYKLSTKIFRGRPLTRRICLVLFLFCLFLSLFIFWVEIFFVDMSDSTPSLHPNTDVIVEFFDFGSGLCYVEYIVVMSESVEFLVLSFAP